jgi:hypothetical protein
MFFVKELCDPKLAATANEIMCAESVSAQNLASSGMYCAKRSIRSSLLQHAIQIKGTVQAAACRV